MREVIKTEARTKLEIKRVGVYCRVSTTHAEQLASLSQQVSYFVKYVQHMPFWILSDVYMDIKSAETISGRTELQRLLMDCRAKQIDLVITKNISRLGRDTLEFLNVIRELRGLGVDVMIENDGLTVTHVEDEFVATIIEAFAQAENESRSENTRWGILKRAKDGTSALYRRRCFGYYTDENGDLQIDENEAAVVRSIFEMYLAGDSIGAIVHHLGENEVKTSTGRNKWSKGTIDKILSNEKYVGNVAIFKTFSDIQYESGFKMKVRKTNNGEHEKYLLLANHPAIVSKEVFAAVQEEKSRRSNVEIVDGQTKRKRTRYNSKKKN